MNIQWFPGHMTKTRRMISAQIKLIDCVVELLDARCPQSSRNPDLPGLCGGKKTLVVLNKCDMADPVETDKWQKRFRGEGVPCLCVSSSDGKGVAKITAAVRDMLADKIERDRQRGMVNRPIRIMVCGIPNVGKSSFINKLCGKGATKVGDRPGVTRGKQWIALNNGIELLDTPGILWPKFEDKDIALRLAFTGAVKDDVLDVEELCAHLCAFLAQNYPKALEERYRVVADAASDGADILREICRKRGFLVKGGECDTLRGANVVLDEFRAAKLGRITLERAF